MKRAAVLCVLAFFIFLVSGCATIRTSKDVEMEGLRERISTLEAELSAKDEEISSLRSASAEMQQVRVSTRSAGEVKSRPKVRQIQQALANAGFDPGPIDGKMGKRTRSAIRTFQSANGLVVDGKVGKQTWGVLGKYLEQKVK